MSWKLRPIAVCMYMKYVRGCVITCQLLIGNEGTVKKMKQLSRLEVLELKVQDFGLCITYLELPPLKPLSQAEALGIT